MPKAYRDICPGYRPPIYLPWLLSNKIYALVSIDVVIRERLLILARHCCLTVRRCYVTKRLRNKYCYVTTEQYLEQHKSAMSTIQYTLYSIQCTLTSV